MKKWLLYFILIIWWILLLLKFSWGILSDIYKQGDNFYINKVVKTQVVDLSTFIKDYKQGDFQKIDVINDKILKWYHFLGTGQATSSMALKEKIIPLEWEVYQTTKPYGTSLKDLGINLTWDTKIIVNYKDEGIWEKILVNLLPVLLIFFLLAFLLRGAMPKWGGPLWLVGWVGKQAKPEKVKTKFKDVAGMEEVKEEVKEIVDYLKNPEKYKKAWAQIPRW